MNIREICCCLTLIPISGCYAEFDLGTRTPRIDPCTGEVEKSYVYVNPTCRHPPPTPLTQVPPR